MSRFRMNLRPQFRLKSLFVLVAAVSVPLALWVNAERRYRLRAAAAIFIHDKGDASIEIVDRPGDDSLPWLDYEPEEGEPDTLRRTDVVIGLSVYDVSDDLFPAILSFPSLKNLHFCCSAISDAQLREIAKVSSIEMLDLTHTNVTDAGIAHLATLRHMRRLDLDDTKISGRALAHVASMTRLEQLNLEDDAVDGESLRHLAGLTCMRKLNLSHTKIDAAGLANLSSMTKLEELDLTADDVTDDSLRHLSRLSCMQALRLRGTRVTDNGLHWLRRLSLRYLELDGCAISDAGLTSVAEMSHVGTVSVCRTSVTSDGASHLHSLKPKIMIEWGPSRYHAKCIRLDGVIRDVHVGTEWEDAADARGDNDVDRVPPQHPSG